MIFNTWEERTDFLSDLQDDVVSEFGTDGYNVFVFGSFITDKYQPGESDIDLAVYADDYRVARDVMDFLDDYLQQKEVPHSLILIDVNQKYAFVAIDPLRLNIGCTGYFPEELRRYEVQLVRRFINYNEEKNMIEKLFPAHW